MAVGGILATALTTHATRSKGLFVGGVDVIDDPSASNLFGVTNQSVSVTENGPGGVSSMSFSIDDPFLTIAVTPGMELRFQDFTADYPIFLGWVQAVSIRPDFGQVGRSFQVEAIGIECMLDWAVLAADYTTVAMNAADFIRDIVSKSIGIGPVRTATASGTNGTQAGPISDQAWGTIPTGLVIPGGTSVREAIRLGLDNTNPQGVGITPLSSQPMVTIDFYYGLRFFRTEQVGFEHPDDYTDETITNTAASTPAATSESLSYATDMGTTHTVYVKGLNAAGTGTVSDGSGLPGDIAYLEDLTVDTAAKLAIRGAAYLSQFASGLRGQYVQSDRVASSTTHPGGMAIVTDARVGLTAARLRIMSINKEFNGVRQDWTISFGGLAPSMVNMVRRLTRTIRS